MAAQRLLPGVLRVPASRPARTVVAVKSAPASSGRVIVARDGIELPVPGARLPFDRRWTPAEVPVDRHSPECRSRCCGTWTVSARPVPVGVPEDAVAVVAVTGPGELVSGQAPAVVRGVAA